MPRRRVKRFFLGLLLSILLIGSGALYTAWRLSWAKPAWYAPPNPHDRHVAQLADDTEYAALEQTQKIRASPQESWTLRLTAEQINAWLAARLPAWIEHDANLHWPEQIGTPQVLIDTDGLRIATPVSSVAGLGGTGARTLVATLKPAIAPDGGLSLPLTGVALGRVWLPGEPLSRLVDAVRGAAPEFLDDDRVRQAIDVLAGKQTLPADYALADGRHITVTGIALGSGFVELTAHTTGGSGGDAKRERNRSRH